MYFRNRMPRERAQNAPPRSTKRWPPASSGSSAATERHEHPARRLVDGEDGAILVKDGNRLFLEKLDAIRSGHA